MDEKERTPDLLTGKMSRRELFAKTAKAAIPTLGIMGLTLTGLTGTAKAMGLKDCDNSCSNNCSDKCASNCGGNCSRWCGSDACGGTCKGSCYQICTKIVK